MVDIDLSILHRHQLLPGLDSKRLHREAYLWLRTHLYSYIDKKTQPILQETPSPVGGYEYYERRGRAVAQLIHKNAKTIIQKSSEICTMQVLAEPEYLIDKN